MTTSKCSVDGCENAIEARRLCQKHYMRLRRTGSATTVRPPGVPGTRRKHPMYGAWAQMINRCYNKNNSSYHRYGGAGVTVCPEWQDDFLNFLRDMGERPRGMTLDRIDPRGNYEPANCRWASAKTQRKNQSSVHWRDRQRDEKEPNERLRNMRQCAALLELD